MNFNFKTFILSTALVPLIVSCSNDSKVSASNIDSASAKMIKVDEHAHTFRCPMHPEVTGKEGDTCPKCGMKLEHSDDAPTTAGTYFMQFASNPSVIEANKEVALSVTPKKKDKNNDLVPLDIEHEKKIHFIIVSDDLSYFDHIHPEYNTDGSYTVKTKFPVGGKYKAFADYKPTGGDHVVDKIEIDVKGNTPAAKSFSADKLSGNSDNYSFTLTPDAKLISGSLTHLKGVVMKDGKEIDAGTLDNYLGAKAHMVVISMNEKEYLHVHPNVENGKFDLHTSFAKPGLYRGWVQFNAGGKIRTIDFTMNVAKGTVETKPAEDHSEHSH